MAPGHAADIFYISVDNCPWRAALQPVHHGLVPGSTNDPDFVHFPGDSPVEHRDAWIKYKTFDGSFWSARCRSRGNPQSGWITFEFEHWRHGRENGPSHHASAELAFLDWDGRPWLAKIAPMNSSGLPTFILQRAT